MNNTETKTFKKEIWVCLKDVFLKKLDHLNKILEKNGKEKITVKFENYHTELVEITTHLKGDSYANDTTCKHKVEMCDAVCSGYVNVGKGGMNYIFLGTVKFQDGIKQVFVKDENYKEYFMEKFRENFCDHCGTKRKNRKAYYLFLEEETGKVYQIGSTCAKEFFGIDSTAFLEAYGNTFLIDYDGCEEDLKDFTRGAMTADYKTVATFLDYATNGFLKWNKKSGFVDPDAPIYEHPTTEAVRTLIQADIDNPTGLMMREPRAYEGPNCGLLSLNEVLAFWQAKYDQEESSFAYNCLNAIKAGYAANLSLGTFCYAIFAAYNAKVRALQEKEAAGKTYVPCAHEVGKRVDVKGKVTAIREFVSTIPGTENYYNRYQGEEIEKRIVDFTEENGTLYHFTTSAKTFFKVEAGDEISMRCTIGETKPYKGVPYTHVSRPVATILTSAAVA